MKNRYSTKVINFLHHGYIKLHVIATWMPQSEEQGHQSSELGVRSSEFGARSSEFGARSYIHCYEMVAGDIASRVIWLACGTLE